MLNPLERSQIDDVFNIMSGELDPKRRKDFLARGDQLLQEGVEEIQRKRGELERVAAEYQEMLRKLQNKCHAYQYFLHIYNDQTDWQPPELPSRIVLTELDKATTQFEQKVAELQVAELPEPAAQPEPVMTIQPALSLVQSVKEVVEEKVGKIKGRPASTFTYDEVLQAWRDLGDKASVIAATKKLGTHRTNHSFLEHYREAVRRGDIQPNTFGGAYTVKFRQPKAS